MQPSRPPVFGKRNLPHPPSAIAAAAPGSGVPSGAVPADDIQPDHAAFFAAVRSELSERSDQDGVVVPWSFKAASLAGLAVGCALAGFDVTGGAGRDRFEVVAGLFGVQVDTQHLLPAMIALGLFAGARVVTVTVIFVHAVLSKAGLTSHLAYAGGGACASIVVSILVMAATGHTPDHGWIAEVLAGSGVGLCYRAFAGAHPAKRGVTHRFDPASRS